MMSLTRRGGVGYTGSYLWRNGIFYVLSAFLPAFLFVMFCVFVSFCPSFIRLFLLHYIHISIRLTHPDHTPSNAIAPSPSKQPSPYLPPTTTPPSPPPHSLASFTLSPSSNPSMTSSSPSGTRRARTAPRPTSPAYRSISQTPYPPKDRKSVV